MANQPILDGLLQDDINFANHKPTNADLSGYAGAGVVWNAGTKKFDVAGGIGTGNVVASGTPLAGQVGRWTDATHLLGSTWPGTFLSIKDPPYNAAGDGTTNDTAAINTALADLLTAGGGTLFFPKGIYQCNGALLADYNAVLELPFVNASTTAAVSIVLLGEQPPIWSVLFGADFSKNSTIRSATAGSGTQPALLAGNSARAPDTLITPANFNNIRLTIKNMAFLVGDNPTLNGLRLDGVGWTCLEDVFVEGGGSSPTHGTCNVWLPSQNNFSYNYANRVTSAGCATAIRTGEHLSAPLIQAVNALVGVEFGNGIYPSQAKIQCVNVADALKWTGQHPVDVMLENEHAGSSWWASLHEVKDPSNYSSGILKYFIGQGGLPNPAVAISRDGGNDLVYTNLGTGL